MHTEHLQNVKLSILVLGWFVAAAITSLIVLVFEAIGTATMGAPGAVATFLAVAIGFAAGGFFAGFVARRAPILHGAGMGITSIIVWVLANALASGLGRAGWSGLDAPAAVGIVLAQMAAAMLGALVGYNLAVRGKPGLSEEVPAE